LYASVRICEQFIDDDIVPTTNLLEVDEYLYNLVFYPYYKIFQQNITVNGITGLTGLSGQTKQVLISPRDYQMQYYKNYTSIRFSASVTCNKFLCNFNSGYSSIPYDILLAIKMKVAELYDQDRGNYTLANVQRSNAWERLLTPHRRILFDIYPNQVND